VLPERGKKNLVRGGEHWWAGGKEKEEGKMRKEIRGGGPVGDRTQKTTSNVVHVPRY
jgi:hypothetical protein